MSKGQVGLEKEEGRGRRKEKGGMAEKEGSRKKEK